MDDFFVTKLGRFIEKDIINFTYCKQSSWNAENWKASETKFRKIDLRFDQMTHM